SVAVTVMERACVALRGVLELSVTRTINVKIPELDGVPKIEPLADDTKPDGSDPAVIAQDSGVRPPAAVRVCAGYAVPTIAFGREVVVITNGAATRIVSTWFAVWGETALSVTRTVNANVPVVSLGVPEIPPLEAIVTPVGREPPTILHV